MIIPLKPRAGTLVDRSLAGAPTGAFYLFADGPNAPAADACGGPAAVPTGGVTLGPGRFGPAALFNGTTGFFSGGDPDGLRDLPLSPTGFTAAAWINIASLAVAQLLVCKRNAGQTAGWQILINTTGTVRTTLFASVTGSIAQTNAILSVGQWVHVATTFDGSQSHTAGHIALYINGVRQSLGTDTGGSGSFQTDAGVVFLIGATPTATNTFNGAIDHLLIDRRAYGAAEIAALYASPFRNFFPPLTLLKPATAKGAVTRLGLDGYGVKRTGSFAGKIPSVGGSIMPWPLFERMVA